MIRAAALVSAIGWTSGPVRVSRRPDLAEKGRPRGV
jgi:hypothetical protein